MENKKIVVNLYGGNRLFSKKETPLRAEEVYCDKYDKCSLFKNNCCLKVTSPLMSTCKFGELKIYNGYTSRAKKYLDFKQKYEKDEKYNALKHPSNCMVALVDDQVYLDVKFAKIALKDNEFFIDFVGFSNSGTWISLEDLTPSLLYRLCKYTPHAMMGGEITSYKEKCIPEMLQQLKIVIPDLYNSFINEYPEFNIKPNYIGKKAYLKTIKENSLIRDNHNCEFLFDGTYLISQNWKSVFLPFDSKIAEIKIKVTDDMLYKIDDNSLVTDNTKFVQ